MHDRCVRHCEKALTAAGRENGGGLALRGGQREALVDGELDEFGITLEPKLLHDAVLVKGHGAGRDMEDARGFLHRKAFCQQLQHLTLTRRELPAGRPIAALNERLDHAL